MKENKDLEILFHAYSLDNHFSSTKISRLFKFYSENIGAQREAEDVTFFREKLTKLIGVPSEAAWIQAKHEIRHASDIGIEVISFLDRSYPTDLLNIVDPPLTLFISGNLKVNNILWKQLELWSIVGARNATQYGTIVSRHLATEMVKAGITVVSGLAYGIDKSAHEGALVGRQLASEPSIPTIAVLGSGLLEVYPRSHKYLAEEIIESGGFVISEYGLNMLPRSFYFPRRNRIISALSKGVVVVEAKKRSGSLITARMAIEQGRDLYCVPGPIDSSLSDGVNQMIKDGAGIVSSIEDFVESIAPPFRVSESKNTKINLANLNLSDLHLEIFRELQINSYSFDDLLEIKDLDETELRKLLFDLEIKELVVKRDGIYELNQLNSFQKL